MAALVVPVQLPRDALRITTASLFTEIEAEYAGRGEIFAEIESAFLFANVEKVAIPVRRVQIRAASRSVNDGQIAIRLPTHARLFVTHLRVEIERSVLMMQRVIIAA